MRTMVYLLILFTVIFYIAGCVASATLIIAKWEESVRYGVSSMWVLACFMTVMIPMIEKASKADK